MITKEDAEKKILDILIDLEQSTGKHVCTISADHYYDEDSSFSDGALVNVDITLIIP